MLIESLLCTMVVAQQFTAPQAKTTLVSSATTIAPGKTFSVAVKMTMEPGWHSYYANPGESGQATNIKWHLPTGFKAGPIRWPVPTRIVQRDVAGFVYENEVWLVTDIKPPATLAQGKPIQIKADVSWLLCREVCVPQHSMLSLKLTAGALDRPNPEFAPALMGLPTPLQHTNLNARVKNGSALLTVARSGSSASGFKFFPSDPTYFGADTAHPKATASGIILTLPLSKYAPGPPKRLTGILVVPSGVDKGARWIDIQVGNL